MLEKQGSPRVFSDFRAVGQPTHVRITRLWRDSTGTIVDTWRLFDKVVSDFQAVEFAYEPVVNDKGWQWANGMTHPSSLKLPRTDESHVQVELKDEL